MTMKGGRNLGGPVMAFYTPSPTNLGFCHWLRHLRLHYLICFLLIVLITVPFFTHYYLSSLAADNDDLDTYRSRSKLDHPDDLGSMKLADMKYHVEDLQRIKISVNNELRDLESRRQKLLSEITSYNSQLDTLKVEYEKSTVELQQLVATIENRKQEIDEMIQRNKPELQAPGRILPSAQDSVYMPPPRSTFWCRMNNCFDYSRCSITSQFPVYLYNPLEYPVVDTGLVEFVRTTIASSLNVNPHVTLDADIACVYVVIVGESASGWSPVVLQERLHALPYWHGDGRNHILLNAARTPASKDMFDNIHTGRAIIAQSLFTNMQFRIGFDLILPPLVGNANGEVWDQVPQISPARRKHLLSFQGEFQLLDNLIQPSAEQTYKNAQSAKYEGKHSQEAFYVGVKTAGYNQRLNDPHQVPNLNKAVNIPEEPAEYHRQGVQNSFVGDKMYNSTIQKFRVNEPLPNDDSDRQQKVWGNSHIGRNLQSLDISQQAKTSPAHTETLELLELERTVVATLKRMQSLFQEGAFAFDFTCENERILGLNAEWALCGPYEVRHDRLRLSTFSLIIAPTNYSVVSSTVTQLRLHEALQYGAIPVILGDYVQLPFSEFIQWRKAAIVLPKARVTELHFYLQSIADGDILRLRHEGRLIWERYFGTTQSVMDTLMAIIRTRLNIPALPIHEAPSPSAFNGSFVPLTEEVLDLPPEAEEVLGPMEAAFPSPKYQRNFTSTLEYMSWSQDPFHLYPYTPFEPALPAEAKFLGSSLGFRPIGKGLGGAGKEFHQALGGNVPREQFTIVMLTYERDAVLMNALRRLKGLPHLNKVLVVWNSPQPPAEDLKWPDIGVPVHVIKTSKNSLNNRFLPYDLIDTEAILSIDDDAHLRQDEITFGFRVWREARDRLVGFPGRFHSWDLDGQQWLYNSNYSCELSMVLTGAAFFHKYYAYMYSYVMAPAIREKVDEYMNCEDLAMNFLISHLTRKPPIKVTSRWTFRCPGCPQALSEDDSHFKERHKCINFFSRVYGYMPLLNTQFRADSVLFKTRIPHDKQKCFKFI